jgi:hypothetical protein
MLTTISAAAMRENLLHFLLMNSSYENLLGSDIRITNTKDHPEHVSQKEHLSRLLPLSKSFRYKLDPFRSTFSDEEYRHSSEKSVKRSLIATTKRDFFGRSIRKW